MRLKWLITLAVLVVSRGGAVAAEASGWLTDYDEARTLAGRSGKPLFVVFRFVGRWACFGVVIRGLCVILAVLKVLTLIAHPPPA